MNLLVLVFQILSETQKLDKNSTYVLVSDGADDVLVVAGIPHKLALEEGNVQDGGVEVDELEDEHLEGQVVVKVRLCPMHLCKTTRYQC